ncbi:MAG: sterol desaturase family protein [Sandaracinaceae bacterium]|nr:sterol desaturase family protein [Sandaracinaceae bacterium]
MLALYLPILGIMAIDGALLALLGWAYDSPRFASQRISPMPPLRVGMRERMRYFAVSSTLSLVFLGAMTWALWGFGISGDSDATHPLWRDVLDAVVVLFVYDFLYYFLHRLMHHKKLVRHVHAVHHRARNPSALESFYLHPVELFAGLALLHACIGGHALLLGPMSITGYALLFFVHSTLNILVHSGIVFGAWYTWPIDYLAKKHSVHHKDDAGKNYSSLTPIPDTLFGTAG